MEECSKHQPSFCRSSNLLVRLTFSQQTQLFDLVPRVHLHRVATTAYSTKRSKELPNDYMDDEERYKKFKRIISYDTAKRKRNQAFKMTERKPCEMNGEKVSATVFLKDSPPKKKRGRPFKHEAQKGIPPAEQDDQKCLIATKEQPKRRCRSKYNHSAAITQPADHAAQQRTTDAAEVSTNVTLHEHAAKSSQSTGNGINIDSGSKQECSYEATPASMDIAGKHLVKISKKRPSKEISSSISVRGAKKKRKKHSASIVSEELSANADYKNIIESASPIKTSVLKDTTSAEPIGIAESMKESAGLEGILKRIALEDCAASVKKTSTNVEKVPGSIIGIDEHLRKSGEILKKIKSTFSGSNKKYDKCEKLSKVEKRHPDPGLRGARKKTMSASNILQTDHTDHTETPTSRNTEIIGTVTAELEDANRIFAKPQEGNNSSSNSHQHSPSLVQTLKKAEKNRSKNPATSSPRLKEFQNKSAVTGSEKPGTSLIRQFLEANSPLTGLQNLQTSSLKSFASPWLLDQRNWRMLISERIADLDRELMQQRLNSDATAAQNIILSAEMDSASGSQAADEITVHTEKEIGNCTVSAMPSLCSETTLPDSWDEFVERTPLDGTACHPRADPPHEVQLSIDIIDQYGAILTGGSSSSAINSVISSQAENLKMVIDEGIVSDETTHHRPNYSEVETPDVANWVEVQESVTVEAVAPDVSVTTCVPDDKLAISVSAGQTDSTVLVEKVSPATDSDATNNNRILFEELTDSDSNDVIIIEEFSSEHSVKLPKDKSIHLESSTKDAVDSEVQVVGFGISVKVPEITLIDLTDSKDDELPVAPDQTVTETSHCILAKDSNAVATTIEEATNTKKISILPSQNLVDKAVEGCTHKKEIDKTAGTECNPVKSLLKSESPVTKSSTGENGVEPASGEPCLQRTPLISFLKSETRVEKSSPGAFENDADVHVPKPTPSTSQDIAPEVASAEILCQAANDSAVAPSNTNLAELAQSNFPTKDIVSCIKPNKSALPMPKLPLEKLPDQKPKLEKDSEDSDLTKASLPQENSCLIDDVPSGTSTEDPAPTEDSCNAGSQDDEDTFDTKPYVLFQWKEIREINLEYIDLCGDEDYDDDNFTNVTCASAQSETQESSDRVEDSATSPGSRSSSSEEHISSTSIIPVSGTNSSVPEPLCAPLDLTAKKHVTASPAIEKAPPENSENERQRLLSPYLAQVDDISFPQFSPTVSSSSAAMQHKLFDRLLQIVIISSSDWAALFYGDHFSENYDEEVFNFKNKVDSYKLEVAQLVRYLLTVLGHYRLHSKLFEFAREHLELVNGGPPLFIPYTVFYHFYGAMITFSVSQPSTSQSEKFMKYLTRTYNKCVGIYSHYEADLVKKRSISRRELQNYRNETDRHDREMRRLQSCLTVEELNHRQTLLEDENAINQNALLANAQQVSQQLMGLGAQQPNPSGHLCGPGPQNVTPPQHLTNWRQEMAGPLPQPAPQQPQLQFEAPTDRCGIPPPPPMYYHTQPQHHISHLQNSLQSEHLASVPFNGPANQTQQQMAYQQNSRPAQMNPIALQPCANTSSNQNSIQQQKVHYSEPFNQTQQQIAYQQNNQQAQLNTIVLQPCPDVSSSNLNSIHQQEVNYSEPFSQLHQQIAYQQNNRQAQLNIIPVQPCPNTSSSNQNSIQLQNVHYGEPFNQTQQQKTYQKNNQQAQLNTIALQPCPDTSISNQNAILQQNMHYSEPFNLTQQQMAYQQNNRPVQMNTIALQPCTNVPSMQSSIQPHKGLYSETNNQINQQIAYQQNHRPAQQNAFAFQPSPNMSSIQNPIQQQKVHYSEQTNQTQQQKAYQLNNRQVQINTIVPQNIPRLPSNQNNKQLEHQHTIEHFPQPNSHSQPKKKRVRTQKKIVNPPKPDSQLQQQCSQLQSAKSYNTQLLNKYAEIGKQIANRHHENSRGNPIKTLPSGPTVETTVQAAATIQEGLQRVSDLAPITVAAMEVRSPQMQGAPKRNRTAEMFVPAPRRDYTQLGAQTQAMPIATQGQSMSGQGGQGAAKVKENQARAGPSKNATKNVVGSNEVETRPIAARTRSKPTLRANLPEVVSRMFDNVSAVVESTIPIKKRHLPIDTCAQPHKVGFQPSEAPSMTSVTAGTTQSVVDTPSTSKEYRRRVDVRSESVDSGIGLRSLLTSPENPTYLSPDNGSHLAFSKRVSYFDLLKELNEVGLKFKK